MVEFAGNVLQKEKTTMKTENETAAEAALPPATCSACLGDWRPDGEQAVIDATLDANDRVRERRFAKGLPCLLTGLTKEQWEAQK